MKITINSTVCTTIDEVKQVASAEVAHFVAEYFNDKDYVVAHTSGSTGAPKEIHLLKRDMQASARLTNAYFAFGEGSVFYLCLSPKYIAGKMMIVRAIECNGNLIEEAPSNMPMASYRGEEKISLLAIVPSQVKYLLNNPEKLQLVNTIIIGGGRLTPSLEHWLAEYGVNAYKTYGMTETCSHVALALVGKEEQPFAAIGDVKFYVDERDCLVIEAPQFSNSVVHTNDVVELIDEKHFYWRGRADNVINTGGIKVFPEEVEQKIYRLFPAIRYYITSQPSEKWGEEVVLAFEYSSLPDGVVKRGDVQPALIDKMKQLLPTYAIPRKYVAVKKFEETATGKILRRRR